MTDPADKTYSRTAMSAEMLDSDTERQLTLAWRDHGDEEALHRLINAYARLAISMAAKFRRYGAPMNDLVQEASLGLMKAADKFDPDRGVRFSTYAIWWIRASIQDYVMRNWSLVRTGSTSAQKSLFFNMRRLQARFEREAAADGTVLSPEEIDQRIAEELGVPVSDVQMMSGRLSGGDFSLNVSQSTDEEGRAWIDTIEDDAVQAEEQVTAAQDQATLREWLMQALLILDERERLIVAERKLREEPRTLESLGQELGLSKERVRQLEAAAFEKMRKELQKRFEDVKSLLT